MRPRSLSRLAATGLLAGLLALALAAPAAASGPDDLSFGDGEITGLVVDSGFTEASFQNLHYEADFCGSPHELTCTWEVWLEVVVDSTKDCPASAAVPVVWSSSEQAGNGSYDSGPQSFGLQGCKGQVLVVHYEFRKTYGDWGDDPVPPLILTGGGGTSGSVALGYYPIAEMERAVIDASPPAHPEPPPTPPPALRASPDCRSLYAGATRYVFVFRGIGCRKATTIASSTRFGDASPNGYRCALKPAGGGRCVREGNPGKFLEWHRPRRPAAKGA